MTTLGSLIALSVLPSYLLTPLKLLLILLVLLIILILIALLRFQLLVLSNDIPKKSCLYIGRVKHHRLKGGAMHALNYPLCFSFLDLKVASSSLLSLSSLSTIITSPLSSS